jgi:RNA polymerase sigma-70 factor (ECF subfamily)
MSTAAHAFEQAVRSLSGELYRFAFWLARDRHVAEDLVQECFQRAWKNWDSLQDAQALKKWLFTILRNEFLRRVGCPRHDTVELDELSLGEDREALTAAGLALDEVCALRQALARLPDSLREPLLLQVLGGFSAEEIGEIYQTSPGAITTRLSRARSELRAYLACPTEDSLLVALGKGGRQ